MNMVQDWNLKAKKNKPETNFKNMIGEKFHSNALNNGNRILLYTSVTAVDDNKRTSENSIWKTRNHEITPPTMNFWSTTMTTRNEELAEQWEKKERSCNIIIHGREETKEQSETPYL